MTDSYSDHTLQINTFNRPQFLFRALKYISADLPVGRVQIIDGSTEPCRSQNLEIIARFADLMPIHHVQLEPGINAIEQFRAGIGRTETAYLTRCDDDNFVTPSSVRHSVEFLRANPDYAVCSGIVTYVTKKDGRISACMHDVAPMEQDDPLDRLAYFLANHWTADFATWRAEARKHACAALDMFFIDETMGEPLSIGVGALHGKFHVIPEFSVVFCNHDGHLGLDARSRQFGPSSAAFADNLTAVGKFLTDYCTSLGITPPADPREYYLSAYFYYMAKWYFLFGSIGDKVREKGAEGLSKAVLKRHDERSEDEILKTLLGLPEQAIAWIRDNQAARQAETKRVNYEVFIVQGHNVVLRDMPAAPANEAALMELPSGRDLPRYYRPFLERMADNCWRTVLDDFRAQSAEAVLGAEAASDEQDGLFRGAFIRALTTLIRPLNYIHPVRPDHWGRRLDLWTADSLQLEQFLDAITLYDIFDTPDMPDESALARAITQADERNYRVIHSHPTPGTEPVPVSVDSNAVVRQGMITFIPLDINDVLRERCDADNPAWLGINLKAIKGRLQFGLYADGQIDFIRTKTDQDEIGEFFLPVQGLRYDYLFLRDLGAANNRGSCEIGGLRLFTSPLNQVSAA